MPNLYIIPSLLAEDGAAHVPVIVKDKVKSLDTFIVERTRTARRYIRTLIPDFDIDGSKFYELDKHDGLAAQAMINDVLKSTHDVGLISEAGTPCIADPGAMVVHLARRASYVICPLSGPSSITLALMASGMNGQEFTFNGYLPIKEPGLGHKLSQISSRALEGITQLFIETPYRNDKLLQQIKKHVDPSLFVSISIDLTSVNETHHIIKAANTDKLTIGKRPAIYCIGRLQ